MLTVDRAVTQNGDGAKTRVNYLQTQGPATDNAFYIVINVWYISYSRFYLQTINLSFPRRSCPISLLMSGCKQTSHGNAANVVQTPTYSYCVFFFQHPSGNAIAMNRAKWINTRRLRRNETNRPRLNFFSYHLFQFLILFVSLLFPSAFFAHTTNKKSVFSKYSLRIETWYIWMSFDPIDRVRYSCEPTWIGTLTSRYVQQTPVENTDVCMYLNSIHFPD